MKVPEPKKLPSGSWFIQLRLGGESIPVTASSKPECVKAAELIKAEYRNGKREKSLDGSKKTLTEAIDDYIDKRNGTLSPSTIRGYRSIQRNRFKPVMKKQIKGIKDWKKICNDEAKLCSAKTMRNSWLFIASVIRETTGAEPEKVSLPQVPKSDRPYLEPEEVLKFVSAVKGEKCEIPALLALHSMRISEICALTWDKVDLENKRILVKGAVVPDENHKLVEKMTNKNTASQRYIPILMNELALALAEHKGEEGKVALYTPEAIRRQINRICEANSLPKVGVHGLRHSFASLAYHLQVPEMVVMQIGGWSDSGTMRKIYTHLAQKDVVNSENKFESFFKNANKNANEISNALETQEV